MIIYVFPFFTTWRQSCPIDGLFYCFQFETSIVNKRLLRIGILSTDNDFSINVYFLIHGREVNQRIIMRPLLHSPNTVFNLTRNSLVWKQLSRSRCNYDLLRWTWGYYLYRLLQLCKENEKKCSAITSTFFTWAYYHTKTSAGRYNRLK